MARTPGIDGDGAARRRGLVLVVEDEGEARTVLARFLSSRGYAVLEAADGSGAISLALKKKPDIVLLDIAMPGKDGLEVLKELAPAMPDTGFIMVTANEDEELARSCLECGAFDYVTKPVNLDSLARSIKARLLVRKPPSF